MARVLLDKAIGYVQTPQSLILVDDQDQPVSGSAKSGRLTLDAVRYLHSLLVAVTSVINGKLTLGDGTSGSKAGNFDGQFISVLSPAGADTEFAVDHALGRIPVSVRVALADKHATVRTSSLGSWSGNRIYLKCSASSVTLRLLLE